MEGLKLFILQQVVLIILSLKIISQMGFNNIINLINLYSNLLVKMEKEMVFLDLFKMEKVKHIQTLRVQLKYKLYKYGEKAIQIKK